MMSSTGPGRDVSSLVTATRPPASPAVSTLSKKTTSSSGSLTNSSSEAARRSRMSVDDILSSSKLSLDGRAAVIHSNNSNKEKRETAVYITSTMAASDGADNKSSSTPTDSSITKRGEFVRGNNSASSSTEHRKRTLNKYDQSTVANNNPGTEERKKRLEYMQQEKLQHQYQQQKHKQHKSSKQSLDNKNSSSSISSTQQLSQNSATTSSSLISSSPSSSLSKVISSVTTIGKLGEENETTIEASSPDQEVALTSFITEYKSCIQQLRQSSSSETFTSQSDYVFEGQQGGEMTETEQSIKGIAPAASPWTIVQSFQSVLQHQHPYDKTFLYSNTCQQIVNGLANVLKSVNSIKWMVINRNNNNSIPFTLKKQTNVNDSSRDERRIILKETATTNEIHNNNDDDYEIRNNVYLLQLIQLQIWIRMILWNNARDVGWEIVQRAIALTTDDDVATNNVKKSKKKKKVVVAVAGKEGLIDNVRLLTELVPYVIPVSMNLSQWLKYTLTFGFRQRIPDYGTILFDHFEIELIDEPSTIVVLNQTTTINDNLFILVPAVPDKDVNKRQQQGALLNATTNTDEDSPTKQLLAKRHNRQRSYFASLVKEGEGKEMSTNSNTTIDNNVTNTTVSQMTTTTTSNVTKSSSVQEEQNIDKLLFKTSVSLTATASIARTSNPFLKGSARGNYVGSHLGSKLSNITTLFREVKAAPPPAKKKRIPMKTQVAEKMIIDVMKNTLRPLGTIASMTTAAVVLRKRKVDDTTLSPTLTPMKTIRSRHSRGVLPMSTIAETPSQHHHQSVIDETPAKSQISTRTIRHCRDAIVTETPVQQRDQLQLLRHSIQLQMESPIVAETPLHRLSTRGGGDESRSKQGFYDRISSTVLPTNLWRSNNPSNEQQKQNKRLLSSTNLVRRPQQQQQQMYHLSPMRDQGRSTTSSSSNDVAQSSSSSSLTNSITSPIVQQQQQQQLRLFGLSPLSSNDNNSNNNQEQEEEDSNMNNTITKKPAGKRKRKY